MKSPFCWEMMPIDRYTGEQEDWDLRRGGFLKKMINEPTRAA